MPSCEAFDLLAKAGNPTWKNGAWGFEGWYIQSDSMNDDDDDDGDGNGFKYGASTGTDSGGGGVHSSGMGLSDSDPTLGAIARGKGAASIAFGKLLINDTTSSITSLTVNYTWEQWRSASSSPQSILLSHAVSSGATGHLYSVAAAGGVAYLFPTVLSGSRTSGDNKGLSWNNAPTATFTSANLSGSGVARSSAEINVTLTGLTISPQLCDHAPLAQSVREHRWAGHRQRMRCHQRRGTSPGTLRLRGDRPRRPLGEDNRSCAKIRRGGAEAIESRQKREWAGTASIDFPPSHPHLPASICGSKSRLEIPR